MNLAISLGKRGETGLSPSGGLVLVGAGHALVIAFLWSSLTPPAAVLPTQPEIAISLVQESRETPAPRPTARPQAAPQAAPARATPVLAPLSNIPFNVPTVASTGTAVAAKAEPAPPAPPAVVPPRFDAAYLSNPAPAYPPLSRRAGEEGRVLLRVQVSPDGTATAVETETSSGHPRLDAAARTAVQKWRFVPARLGSQAVAASVLVPIAFKLNPSSGENP